MGIAGLLPLVKGIMKRKHIGAYSGTRVGIDGHAWLHQALPAIAFEQYNGVPTEKHLKIIISKLQSLLTHKIVPVFVFDGDFLVSKEKTNTERALLRKKAKQEVEFYLKRNDMAKAKEAMKRCTSVTPDLLLSVLNMLRNKNIEYIVAPYEADAQLYFLQKTNYIQHVLTEDSDLIVYGCNSVLYKFSGTHVDEYDSKLLSKARDDYFRENITDICILSGCDYLDSIKGVGLITAHKVLKEKGNLEAFVQHMATNKKEIPEDYLNNFQKAKNTFLHHIVYNPITQKRQYLIEPSECYDFLGTLEESNVTFTTALGGNIYVNRHYKEKTKVVSSIAEEDIEMKSIDNFECEVDPQLELPYFE